MLKNDKVSRLLPLAILVALLMGPATGVCAYLEFHDGVYTLSTPAKRNRPPERLPEEAGKAVLERLLDPAHMALTGLGDLENATLHIGDCTKAELFAALGQAKALPLRRRCVSSIGYVSVRPGDSTLVVIGMGNSCLDNPNYVASLGIYYSPSALPRDFRPFLKHFAPSAGIRADLATQSGLRLGLTREEVEGILGKPLWQEKDLYSYNVNADTLLPAELLASRWKWPKDVKAKPGDVQHTIDIWFVGGRVSAIYMQKLYDM